MKRNFYSQILFIVNLNIFSKQGDFTQCLDENAFTFMPPPNVNDLSKKAKFVIMLVFNNLKYCFTKLVNLEICTLCIMYMYKSNKLYVLFHAPFRKLKNVVVVKRPEDIYLVVSLLLNSNVIAYADQMKKRMRKMTSKCTTEDEMGTLEEKVAENSKYDPTKMSEAQMTNVIFSRRIQNYQ